MKTVRKMVRLSPKWLQNLVLCAASILVLLAACELLLFRFFFIPTDIPPEAYIDDVIRYEPYEQGIVRWRNEIVAPFAINGQGWNSGIESYSKDRIDGVGRIAIIGDSYVNAVQVPFNASFAESLQHNLIDGGCAVEVFRFGMDGAPLSQYLHVLRKEVIDYEPDLIVTLLIHNDFGESFLFKPGRYRSSFLKLEIEEGVVSGEIDPKPYEPGIFTLLRKSGIFRYFYYTQGIKLNVLREIIFGRTRRAYEANIDVKQAMDLLNQSRVATQYVLSQMAEISNSHSIEFVVMMDGHRQAVYGEASEDRRYGPLALNGLVADVADRYNIPFVDLHGHFVQEWAEEPQRFEYRTNWHWNQRGHDFVAEVLANFLQTRRVTLGCSS